MAQNQTGGANRRFWSMFPLTRVDFGTGFLSHSLVKIIVTSPARSFVRSLLWKPALQGAS